MATACETRSGIVVALVIALVLYVVLTPRGHGPRLLERFAWLSESSGSSGDDVLTVNENGEIVTGRKVELLESRIQSLQTKVAELEATIATKQPAGNYLTTSGNGDLGNLTVHDLNVNGKITSNNIDVRVGRHINMGERSNIHMRSSGKIQFNSQHRQTELHLGKFQTDGSGSVSWDRVVSTNQWYGLKNQEQGKWLTNGGNTDKNWQNKYRYQIEKK